MASRSSRDIDFAVAAALPADEVVAAADPVEGAAAAGCPKIADTILLKMLISTPS
jgi:hypothetical protein